VQSFGEKNDAVQGENLDLPGRGIMGTRSATVRGQKREITAGYGLAQVKGPVLAPEVSSLSLSVGGVEDGSAENKPLYARGEGEKNRGGGTRGPPLSLQRKETPIAPASREGVGTLATRRDCRMIPTWSQKSSCMFIRGKGSAGKGRQIRAIGL